MNNSISSLKSGGVLNPIDEIRSGKLKESAEKKPTGGVTFDEFLNDRLEQSRPLKAEPAGQGILAELKFSAHAKARLSSRGIELSPDEIVKMQEAIHKVGQKGSKESLILTDKAAFVVSVKNNTVITAMDRDSMKENVFTNIDSTVMI